MAAGVGAGWLAGGNGPALRSFCRTKGVGYVLAVARDHRVTTGVGVRRAVGLAVRPDLAGQRISAGQGARGHRWYEWA